MGSEILREPIVSPNTSIMPVTAVTNELDHLVIGGCDTVELASRFGTPLWIIDYETVRAAARECQFGLESYPDSTVLYAGKAFMCLAICKIVTNLGLGIDVVSEGELYTALKAGVSTANIYLHGNNKSDVELRLALANPGVKIVVDSRSELTRLANLAREEGASMPVDILIRVTPGVEPETHHYIKTGQLDSKFGIPIADVNDFVRQSLELREVVAFRGFHVHIGSQTHKIEPYLEIAEILADLAMDVKKALSHEIDLLDVGGGLGIAYTYKDEPMPISDWSSQLCKRVKQAFESRGLKLPHLLLEPGRSIVGPAGVTLYRAGEVKTLSDGSRCVAVDGGMADNPRPSTYKALYTSAIADRMRAEGTTKTTLVGRYCESGDIIIKDAGIPADQGDLIAVFSTGAYNYSMSSNYNRTGRPACVLVKDGQAELILERESNDDLLRMDRIPKWLEG